MVAYMMVNDGYIMRMDGWLVVDEIFRSSGEVDHVRSWPALKTGIAKLIRCLIGEEHAQHHLDHMTEQETTGGFQQRRPTQLVATLHDQPLGTGDFQSGSLSCLKGCPL